MVSRHSCRMYVTAALLALATLAGCQNTDAVRTAHRSAGPTEATPPLTAAQQADLRFAMGRSLERGGDLDRAIALYTETVQMDPKRLDARLRLAAVYEGQGRISEAHECYTKALALQPGNPDVLCNVGYSLYLEQNWPHAEEYLRRALQLKPNHTRAHNNLGLVLARLGRRDEAYAEFKKAGCSNAEAHANLAYCSMVQGKVALARQDYQTALNMDSNCAPAKSALQDLNVLEAHMQTSQPGATTPASLSSQCTSSPPNSTDTSYRTAVRKAGLAFEDTASPPNLKAANYQTVERPASAPADCTALPAQIELSARLELPRP